MLSYAIVWSVVIAAVFGLWYVLTLDTSDWDDDSGSTYDED